MPISETELSNDGKVNENGLQLINNETKNLNKDGNEFNSESTAESSSKQRKLSGHQVNSIQNNKMGTSFENCESQFFF